VTVDAEVRRLLGEAAGDPAAADVPADTPLLAGGLGLDSVAVVRLLAGITGTLGVDVADLDLDLDSLATLATLVTFVTEQRYRAPGG
jgi:acyl carrier protein